MIEHDLQHLMRQVAETADFRTLFDWFSDDVELRTTMAVTSSTGHERRGRESVIHQLQNLRNAAKSRTEDPIEFFAGSERFVACHDEAVAIAAGLDLRCERTLVFDVHHGLITRIAIHYELSPAVRRPAAAVASATAEA